MSSTNAEIGNYAHFLLGIFFLLVYFQRLLHFGRPSYMYVIPSGNLWPQYMSQVLSPVHSVLLTKIDFLVTRLTQVLKGKPDLSYLFGSLAFL